MPSVLSVSGMELPDAFVRRVVRDLGPEEGAALCAALDGVPPVSLRLHPAKCGDAEALLQRAEAAGQVPWCPDGHYLARRPQFTFDPAFHAGAYYVQEASSQFVGRLVGDVVGRRVLDLCAAPGGKTTLYASLVGPDGLVVANEIDRRRASVLADNVRKWGTGNVAVTACEPRALGDFEGWFDVVAVDAPCSGEGMFRKDIASRTEWSENNVRMCAARQEAILTEAWRALKPGGRLIYSTCTFNRQENEEMVAYMVSELDAEPVATGLPSGHGIAPGLATPYPCRRFMPHLLQGEGLFLAVLRKPEDGDSRKGRVDGNIKGRNKHRPAATSPVLLRQVADQASELIESPQDYTFHIDSPGDTAA